jgi:hypothetical protein
LWERLQLRVPGALDRALVAADAGAEDVANFDQRRGEEVVDGEIRHPSIAMGVRRWLDLTPFSPNDRVR